MTKTNTNQLFGHNGITPITTRATTQQIRTAKKRKGWKDYLFYAIITFLTLFTIVNTLIYFEDPEEKIARHALGVKQKEERSAHLALNIKQKQAKMLLLVKGSDDYNRYKTQFIEAAEKLLSSNKCIDKDLLDNGGWVRSTSKGAGYYFTYCLNGVDRYRTVQDRYYVNVFTGKVSR